jgi:hypothetical protein
MAHAHARHTCILLWKGDVTRRLRRDGDVEAKGVAPALAEVQLCWQGGVAVVCEVKGADAGVIRRGVQGGM